MVEKGFGVLSVRALQTGMPMTLLGSGGTFGQFVLLWEIPHMPIKSLVLGKIAGMIQNVGTCW